MSGCGKRSKEVPSMSCGVNFTCTSCQAQDSVPQKAVQNDIHSPHDRSKTAMADSSRATPVDTFSARIGWLQINGENNDFYEGILKGQGEALTAVLDEIIELGYWTPHCDQCSNQKYVVKVDEITSKIRAWLEQTK